ncbi:hypothetical protein L207DRAFT_534597 [Hyaloscypha variabilis F]|uniref:VWFA domain-containing protein n=1 Tax=Hyaloscypha variabilis (strain UAMH 11265 / GT02V1 / F) TaxID=1149755 RepID=A0A2J6R6W2_HYAVF|nr:hypothetical protein L207DRAFT_534597 [Hyaloscypha variabilis F]
MVKLASPLWFTLSVFPSICFGFMPNKIGGIWTPGNTKTHAKQTEDEINNFIGVHWGIMSDDDFSSTMKKARKAIIDANAYVDDGPEKNIGKCHFDDELFADGQQHLMELRAEMIGLLQQEDLDADTAREDLGRQLHTLQDFYAHSNWVESGHDVPSTIIGWPGQVAYPTTDSVTCDAFCQNPVTTDYLSHLSCLDNCKVGDQYAWQLTLQTICVELQPFACALPDCSSNLVSDFNGITSGYYETDDPSSERPDGKCTHGGLNDRGAEGTEGINKDSEWALYAPHGLIPSPSGGNAHQVAAALSQGATQDYLQQLVVDYTSLGMPALSESELKNLFGIGASPLVFVVDCTGNEDVFTTTTSSTEFLDDLGTLYASGGGDCPELALSALEIVIPGIDPFSNVFLFTDATDKDPQFFDDVVRAATAKNIRVNFFLFPSECSDGSSYSALAQATTGIFIPMPDRTGTEDLVTMALRMIDPDLVDIYGDYPDAATDSTLAKRADSQVSILVDSTMTSIMFLGAGPSIVTVTRPDRSVVNPTDPGVSYFSNAATTFVTVSAPQPGTWTATRSDATDGTTLQVQTISKLTFIDFSFVEVRGHHPGYFPINETLISGLEYTVNADIEGTQDVDSFEFRSSNTGQLLTTFSMIRLNDSVGSSPEHIWYNNVTVPCGTFYAYALGKDQNGFPFQRMFPSVFNTTASCNASIPIGGGNFTITVPSNGTLPTVSSTGSPTSSLYRPPSSGNRNFSSTTTMTSSSVSSVSSFAGNLSTSSSATTGCSSRVTTCLACQSSSSLSPNGQGVPMTKTIIVLSTVTVCPYISTASPCPYGSETVCEVSTHSLSTVPYTTSTVLVPIPGATPAYKTKESLRETVKCNFGLEYSTASVYGTHAFHSDIASTSSSLAKPVITSVPASKVSTPYSTYAPGAGSLNGTSTTAATAKISPANPSVAVNATIQQFKGSVEQKKASLLALGAGFLIACMITLVFI